MTRPMPIPRYTPLWRGQRKYLYRRCRKTEKSIIIFGMSVRPHGQLGSH